MLRSRFMDSIGDGTGSINMSVDGSTTNQIFKIQANQGQILQLSRLLIFIQDSGTLDSGGFGNGSALTNGIIFNTVRYAGTPEQEILPGFQENQLPIKLNQEFKALCHDAIFSNYGSGSQSLSWRYTFTKDTNGTPIPLNHSLNEEFWVTIRDDLTTKCDFLRMRVGCFDYP